MYMAGLGICSRRIPAHLRSTQCSIMLHLIDILRTGSDQPSLFTCGLNTGD